MNSYSHILGWHILLPFRSKTSILFRDVEIIPKNVSSALDMDSSGEAAAGERLFVLTNIVELFDSLKFMLVLL